MVGWLGMGLGVGMGCLACLDEGGERGRAGYLCFWGPGGCWVVWILRAYRQEGSRLGDGYAVDHGRLASRNSDMTRRR